MMFKTKKILKVTSLVVLIVILLLSGLSLHLYNLNDIKYGPLRSMQMSRIDFKEPIDASLSKKIKSCIAKTEGVKHVYFNEVDDIVVYSHDPKLQSSQQVFETVQSAFPVQMERYIVSSDMAQRSCPVTGKNSVFLRFGGLLSNVLK